jgi:polyphosphate glucokinase
MSQVEDLQPTPGGSNGELAIGIDIGGTGIKAAPVDVRTGRLAASRHYLDTPRPATPEAVAQTVLRARAQFADLPADTPVGVAIPAVVRQGITRSAANIDAAWIGLNASALFERTFGMDVVLLNDADAAGLAEVALGAGRGIPGVTVVITLGTGVGSALFLDGRLVPNTEFGHLELGGIDVCPWACALARVRENLSWTDWTARLQAYLSHVEALMWPDLIVIGGGISADAELFLPLLNVEAPVVRAHLGNDAGIIGAAHEAHRQRAASAMHGTTTHPGHPGLRSAVY